MKEKKRHMGTIKIYCDDLEKKIDRDGCYDAKGSTICKACLEKPAPKQVKKMNKDKNKVSS
jgi:hypothetical protein